MKLKVNLFNWFILKLLQLLELHKPAVERHTWQETNIPVLIQPVVKDKARGKA